ncbi:hypothetical protein KHA80_15075 [Anaerobacillus sp. HL2]|nr:hypothetical protein KHA80_15075 [Anaerobacillus sp. HL2]
MQQAASSLMMIAINAMLIRFGTEFHVGLFGIVQRIAMFMLATSCWDSAKECNRLLAITLVVFITRA